MSPGALTPRLTLLARAPRQMFVNREGIEGMTSALVELALELYPVEAQGVQEALHHVHAHHHTNGH